MGDVCRIIQRSFPPLRALSRRVSLHTLVANLSALADNMIRKEDEGYKSYDHHLLPSLSMRLNSS